MSRDKSEMLPVELTLVVAATRNMGIGRNGTLPWTGLKKEMAYFARVTKRTPPLLVPSHPLLLLSSHCLFLLPFPFPFYYHLPPIYQQ